MAAAFAFQGGGQFAEIDVAVFRLVEFGENIIRLLDVGAAGAERILEFGFADLAVAIGVQLRKQILEGIRGARV